MCKCGCNTCEIETKGPLLTEGKVKSLLSEGLQYHIDKKIPLFETIYRIGSDKHLALIKEARKMYSRNVIDLCEDDEALIKTHLGEFGLYEGVSVPLDLPMLEAEIDYEKEKTWKIQDKFPIEVTARKGWSGNYYTIEPKPMDISYDAFIDLGSDGNVGYTSYNYTTGEAQWTSDSLEQIKQWEEDNQDKIKVIYPKSLNESKAIITFKNDYEVKMNTGEGYDDGFEYFEAGEREQVYILDKNDKRTHVEFGDGTNAFIPTSLISIQDKSLDENRKYNQEELFKLDLIAHRKFDCDYEKCTDEQKAEVLKDKVKVGVKEALQEAKQDIYDKFLDNPSSPKGRAKSLILKFTKEYGDNASSMAVDRFASKNNLKPEEKYILKYITKNNIKISSQPGGPDFSAVSEAKSIPEYIVTKDDHRKSKFPFDKLKNSEFKIRIAGEGKDQNYMIFWKEGGKGDWEWEAGNMKRQLRSALMAIAKRKLPIKEQLDEKKKEKKDPPLNKPKRGGSKAYYVYVRDPKTKKIKKVSFGSGGLRAKIKNPKARKAFAARHNCKNKKDRTKAGYWSCNLPRYAEQLGLGSKMNTFW